MTNNEWLKSLEPAELKAWFDAEHDADARRLQRENMALARDLGECMAERDGLQAAYDGIVAIAADMCRACGFSMVDASGEVVS